MAHFVAHDWLPKEFANCLAKKYSRYLKMISSIKIEGYRGFEQFEMTDLGRVNLLVGPNNCGKTAVLEALHILTSKGDPTALWQLLLRRGERVTDERNPDRLRPEFDVCHLFTGHEVHMGSSFSLSAKNQTPERFIKFEICESNRKELEQELFVAAATEQIPLPFVLQITGSPAPSLSMLPLTKTSAFRRRVSEESPCQFITTESMDALELMRLWDKIVLEPSEALVIRALKFLDPAIERIASQSSASYAGRPTRGGFIIKRKGDEHPIPIGSMGDGMWRMLAMAIAITQCKGGVLLVDEIDTGLHHTVMSDMWRLVYGAAKEYDVQVFVTTHSYDCVYTFANARLNEDDPANSITIQRIETGKAKAVPFDAEEIRIAAERNIEIR